MKVVAGPGPSEDAKGGSVPGLPPASGSCSVYGKVTSQSILPICLCLNVYKDTSHSGLGPSLMLSS